MEMKMTEIKVYLFKKSSVTPHQRRKEDPSTIKEVTDEKERHQLTDLTVGFHEGELVEDGYIISLLINLVIEENVIFEEKMLQMNNNEEDDQNLIRSTSFKVAGKVNQVKVLHEMVIEANDLYNKIRKALFTRIGSDQQALIYETKESLAKLFEPIRMHTTVMLLDHAKTQDFITSAMNEKKKMIKEISKLI